MPDLNIALTVAAVAAIILSLALNIAAQRIAAAWRTEQRNREIASGKQREGKKRKSFDGLSVRLERAGIELGVPVYLTVLLITAAVMAALGWQVAGAVGAAGLAAATLIAAELVIRSRTRARKGDFSEQFAQALPMVADGIRTGLTFEQSFRNVAETMGEPMRSQARQFSAERMYGASVADALESMAQRVNNADVDDLVTAVRVQAQTGGKMSEIVDSIAQSMKDKENVRKHVAIVTAEGRLSEKILAATPFVLFVAMNLLAPDYAGVMLESPAGWIALAVAVAMVAVGVLCIRALFRIKLD